MIASLPLPASGTGLRLRPFARRDVAAYAALLERLSPADVRSRFHSAAAPSSVEQIRTMLFGPHALGGFVVAAPDGTLHGVAHAAAGAVRTAEFGIVVEAAFRRRGFGGALTDALFRALGARGTTTVDAYTLWENHAAAALLASRGFEGRHEGGGTVRWTLAFGHALAS